MLRGCRLVAISFLMMVVEVDMAQNGFWGFVDMASGKYLWRNLDQID
ncbi:hypothetical protein Hanom_Chr02g00166711 [Helianthus anomalus]